MKRKNLEFFVGLSLCPRDTLLDEIPADKSAEYLPQWKIFCPPEILSTEIFCRLNFKIYIAIKAYHDKVKLMLKNKTDKKISSD